MKIYLENKSLERIVNQRKLNEETKRDFIPFWILEGSKLTFLYEVSLSFTLVNMWLVYLGIDDGY